MALLPPTHDQDVASPIGVCATVNDVPQCHHCKLGCNVACGESRTVAAIVNDMLAASHTFYYGDGSSMSPGFGENRVNKHTMIH